MDHNRKDHHHQPEQLVGVMPAGRSSVGTRVGDCIQYGVRDDMSNGEELTIRVMTDAQIETLAKQITAYGTICEQLHERYKSLSTSYHQNSYIYDPRAGWMGRNIMPSTPRHRWNPTIKQLEILERVFEDANKSPPGKEKIKELTAELAKHGAITEHNVYNWFQNRRARFKRKQVRSSDNHESTIFW